MYDRMRAAENCGRLGAIVYKSQDTVLSLAWVQPAALRIACKKPIQIPTLISCQSTTEKTVVIVVVCRGCEDEGLRKQSQNLASSARKLCRDNST